MKRLREAASSIPSWEALYLLLSAAAVIWFVMPIFRQPLAWGSTRDWGYFTFMEEVTRKSLLEFAQFPLWNPYYFGGAEHLANPQTTVLSPTTLLTLTLGTALGLKLSVLLFAGLGFAGMYRLTRLLGSDVPGGCAAGLMYGCSGWFAQHVGGGHWGFAAVALYPWAALFYLLGIENRRYFALALLTSAWVALHWGIYTLPWLFMLMAVIACGQALRERHLQPLKWYLLLALATIGLTAVRLFPVMEYVEQFPRQVIETDRLGLDDLAHIFLIRHTGRQFLDHAWEWPEYGNYLGWIPFLLLMAGFKVKFPRKAQLWLGAFIFLLLAIGNWGPWAPYSLLHQLPLLEHLRVPSRYTLAALFFMAPIAGLALTRLTAAVRERRPGGKWTNQALNLALLLVLIGIIRDPMQFNRIQFEQSFRLPEPSDSVSPEFEQRRGDPHRMYAYPRANQGSVLGLEESPLPRSPRLWINGGQQYLLSRPQGARAAQTYWSPNQLRFTVETPVENLLVVNQNYRSDWRASSGTPEPYQELLAVRLPPGRQQVILNYRPQSFLIGLMVSALTALVAAWWLMKGKGRRGGSK